MTNKALTIILFIILLFALVIVAGVRAYVPPGELRDGIQGIFSTFTAASRGLIIFLALTLTLGAVVGLAWLTWFLWSHGTIWHSQAEIKRAEALKAGLQITIVPAGSQAIITELLDARAHFRHFPGHLLAGALNGEYNPSELDRMTWAYFQDKQSITRPAGRALFQPEQPVRLDSGLPPLLPILVQAQRLIIAGGSDAGKSTLTKHLIAARAEQSRILMIDPHSPSKILGIDVIGAGRKWDQIERALEALELLMQERYTDVAAGAMGYFEHDRVSIFVDEWTAIVKKVKRAGDILGTLLTESRKVNMHLTLLAHSTTVEALGLPDSQIRKSATIVQLVGGNGGQPRRAFILPDTQTTPEGKKARPAEFALPGPFEGDLRAADLVLELPDPKVIKARQMQAEGKSERAIIKEVLGIESPSKYHYNQLRQILGT